MQKNDQQELQIQCKIYQGNFICPQKGLRYGNCTERTDGFYDGVRQSCKGNLTNMLKAQGKEKPSEVSVT